MPAGPRDPKAFTRWFQLDYFRRPRGLRRLYRPVLAAVLLLTGAAAGGRGRLRLLKAGPRPRRLPGRPGVHAARPVRRPLRSLPHRGPRLPPRSGSGRATPTPPRSATRRVSSATTPASTTPSSLRSSTTRPASPPAAPIATTSTAATPPWRACPTPPVPSATPTYKPATARHRYHATVTRFEVDHPPFGEWRKDSGGLRDPGTIHFSHAAHLTWAQSCGTSRRTEPRRRGWRRTGNRRWSWRSRAAPIAIKPTRKGATCS